MREAVRLIEDFHPGDGYAIAGALLSGVCLLALLVGTTTLEKPAVSIGAGIVAALAGFGALLCAISMIGELMHLEHVEVHDWAPRASASVLFIVGGLALILLGARHHGGHRAEP